MNAEKLAEIREDARREAYYDRHPTIGVCLFCNLRSEVESEFGLCPECRKRLALDDLAVCTRCSRIVDGFVSCQQQQGEPMCGDCHGSCVSRDCADWARG